MLRPPIQLVQPPAPPKPTVSLAAETRTAITTVEAALHLNRRPQTLRRWACYQDGPIRPVRINGRLAWRVADLRQLLGQPDAKA